MRAYAPGMLTRVEIEDARRRAAEALAGAGIVLTGAEQDAIDPPFERSLDLLPKLATGRLQDAMAWLHTSPEDEAKRKAALEARKAALDDGKSVTPSQDGAQSPKEKP